MYYIVHKYTTVVYFDKKENLLTAIENALEHSKSEAIQGFELNINVGYTEKYSIGEPRSL